MEVYRARKEDIRHIKYESSFIHNTALIAKEGQEILGVLEYDIQNMQEAEIINLKIYTEQHQTTILESLIDEILYWNPYLRRVSYKEKYRSDILLQCGFIKDSSWNLSFDNDIEVFRIDIEDITPEQLTIDEVKLNKVSSWIEEPEDVIVNCVKIDNKTVSIDGHSRLIAAYLKGFEYVYAYLEPENYNVELYKTCLKWCQDEGIFTIKDLASKIVTPEDHERLWINRCQEFLKSQKK